MRFFSPLNRAAVSLPVIGYFINNRIGLDPLGYKTGVVESTLVVTFTSPFDRSDRNEHCNWRKDVRLAARIIDMSAWKTFLKNKYGAMQKSPDSLSIIT